MGTADHVEGAGSGVSDGLHDGAPGACTEAVIVQSTDRVPVSNPAITPRELGHVGQVL